MFLTRLPVGSWADHHPTFLMRSMAYFPFVGIFIGAWGGVWFQAAVGLWGATTAAAISTLATVWLTGAPSAARPPPPFPHPLLSLFPIAVRACAIVARVRRLQPCVPANAI